MTPQIVYTMLNQLKQHCTNEQAQMLCDGITEILQITDGKNKPK